MSRRTMPAAPSARLPNVRSHIEPRAFERWDPAVRASTDSGDDDRAISVFDVIGEDFWTGEGVTAKRISAALRHMGKGPVTVNVNSPGGDMFEGLAIYNLLREHDGKVTVKVLGLAASAASIVAMAGDEVQIARAGFFMVHNAWVLAIGNRHDLRETADVLEPFDRAMVDIYAARTGKEHKAIEKLVDAESWIGGADAIDQGFADDFLPSDQVQRSNASARATAARRIESALRAQGLPKNEAVRLIAEFKAGAGDPAGGGAGDPAGRGLCDAAAIRETAAIAASLTNWRT